MSPIVVPDAFAEELVGREGDAGRAWVEALPEAVRSCLQRWALTPDGPVLGRPGCRDRKSVV